MKKRKIASLLALAPLALLTACGGGASGLSFTANWHRNTGTRDVPQHTNEQLTYEVSYLPASSQGAFTVNYEKGTYTTTLGYTVQGGEAYYRLRSELNISVQFSLNGETSEWFRDRVTTESVFASVADSLRPVSSTKEVVSTSPLTTSFSPRDELKNNYTTYHYKTVTTYNADMREAVIETTRFTAAKDETTGETSETSKTDSKKVKLSGKDTYLDNDIILFALRGLDMTAPASFRTIDPQTGREVKASTDTPAEIKYAPNYTTETGTVNTEMPCYQVRIGYNTTNPGQGQTLIYAKKASDPNNNTHRNALIRMEVPIIYQHGTLVYNLKSAQFTA